MFLVFVFIGILTGILGGMGMGGGTILIPVLSIFFGVNQLAAQAVNLIVFIPTSIVSVFIHVKNKLIRFENILFIIIPAIMTAVLGFFLAKNLGNEILKKLFGAFLTVLSVVQIFLYKKKKFN